MPSQFDNLNEIVEGLTTSKFSVYEWANSDFEKAVEYSEFQAKPAQESLRVPQAAIDVSIVAVQRPGNRDYPSLFSKIGTVPTNESNIVVSIANGNRTEISFADAVPHIAANDGFGAAGSRAFGATIDAVVAIANGQGRFCAGTLIAPNVVLTARHCEISTTDHVVFGAEYNNSEFSANIASVSLPAGASDVFYDGGDVAIVILSANVPTSVATPLRLLSQTTALVGATATLAGYGDNGIGSVGHNSTSDGFRWGGQNVIDYYGDFGGGANLFAADFDDGSVVSNTLGLAFGSSPIPLDFEAITSAGDSGSPLLIDLDGELVVAAVTSFGLDILGQYGSITFWTGVAPFVQEISQAGGDFVDESIPGPNPLLPPSDDHSNNFAVETTGLSFVSSGANSIARQDAFIGYGNTTADSDFFSFVTTDTGRLIVDAKALSGDLDSLIRVYDSAGTIVGQNDNAQSPNPGNPNDSQLVIRNALAGQYFVSVSGANATTGPYRLAVRSNAQVLQPGDSGSSFGSASMIALNPFSPTTFINASIDAGSERDFFEFTAHVTGQLVIRTNALTGDLNTVIRGYDQNRELLDSNNNHQGTLDSRISLNVSSGESYFLQLSSIGSTKGNYRISLRLESNSGTGNPIIPFRNLTLDESLPVPLPMSVDSHAAGNWPLDQNDALKMGLLSANIQSA